MPSTSTKGGVGRVEGNMKGGGELEGSADAEGGGADGMVSAICLRMMLGRNGEAR